MPQLPTYIDIYVRTNEMECRHQCGKVIMKMMKDDFITKDNADCCDEIEGHVAEGLHTYFACEHDDRWYCTWMEGVALVMLLEVERTY